MAYNTTVNGLQLFRGYPGTLVPATGEFSFVRKGFSSSTYRKKPIGLALLTQLASFTHSVNYRGRAMQFDSDGYQAPSSYNSAPESFDNDTYQDGRKGVVFKVRDKVKGEVWNLSTFLGELPETIAWFRNTLQDVIKLYRAFKRMSFRQVRAARRRRKKANPRPGPFEKGSDTLSSRWLEWRYAVTPLMSDFDSMLKALYDSQTRLLVNRVASGAKLKFHRRGIFANLSQRNIEYVRDHEMDLRIGLYYRVNPSVQAFKRLGLLNPVATLWELVPLSFVVDWFIPVGQYLGSLDAMAGVQVLSSWESQRVKTKYVTTGGLSSSGTSWTSYEPSESWNDYYNRSISPSLSIPLPTFGLSLSTKRFLDGLALTRQILLSSK